MAGIESDVLAAFLAQIRETPEVPDAVVDGLQEMLSAEKLPKAERLAHLFAAQSGVPAA
jgi:hypothetical protein